MSLKDVFKTYLEKGAVFRNKSSLTDQYTPDKIMHRDSEIRKIAEALAPAIRNEKTSNIFIFGTVGTGKSLSVGHVTSELARQSDNINVMYINCKMKKVSDTEYRMLAELARGLGQDVPTTGLPTDQVYRTFFEALDSRKWSVILVLDEIDVLVRKAGDEILYNLTRVNQELKNARLTIIGISNNVSFTDNLDPRVKSSLSEEEIVFPPYNANQLQDILTERASLAFASGALGNGVIAKCSALAAQEHGDARKALDMLRIAGELVEREGGKAVTIEHVDKAESKLDTDRVVEVIRTQPRQSQAVLAAVLSLSENGHKNIQTGDIFSVYESICADRGLKVLTQRRVSDLIAELDMLGIINATVISKGRYGRTREIRIKLSAGILRKAKNILRENNLLDNTYES